MSATHAPTAAMALYQPIRLVASFLVLLVIAVRAFAGQATLAWDPSTDTAVTGYTVHYGQSSKNYTATPLDAGTQTSFTVPNLLEGKTYYFAVTAHDASGTQSAYSNEATSTVPYAAPIASFTSSVTSSAAPLAVTFTSTSTGAISTQSWAFGDGGTATGTPASHTYATAGTYTVRLTVTGPDGKTSTVSKAINVSLPPAPVADFKTSTTTGPAPLAVTFTNSSTGSFTDYTYDFGDGTSSKNFSPASHTYSTPGTYTAKLTVTGVGGQSIKPATITVSPSTTVPAAPVASFTATPVSGVAPLPVTFTSTSTGATSYLWNFGDGTAVSTVAKPVHSYAAAGTYAVSLTVSGPGGSNTQTKTNYITVVAPAPAPTPPVATPDSYTVEAGKTLSVAAPGVLGNDTSLSGKPLSASLVTNTTSGTLSLASNGGLTFAPTAGFSGTTSFTYKASDGATASTATAVTVSVIAPAPSAAPSSGLVAAYGFNEGTGSAASDASGKGNTGAISGATWAARGRFGKALSFNGTSSWVTVKDSPSLDLTTAVTLEAWVYPTALPGWRNVIMKEQPGPAGCAYYLEMDSGKPVSGLWVSGTERQLYGGALPLNTWSHLATTYDGKSQNVYVNGVQVASRGQSGSIQTSGSPMRIGGNSSWGEYFKGLIDEVRIYNRTLSASEIQADMNRPVQ